MSAQLHRLSLPGAMLARGSWLYVWTVMTGEDRTVLYVGKTGDTSSPNAQSPLTRLSQHLDANKHANALRCQLVNANIEPLSCKSFDLIAYGPILPEVSTMADHRLLRNRMAALEKALLDALAQAGYGVLNEVKCRQQLDPQLWQEVREAFACSFPALNSTMTAGASA